MARRPYSLQDAIDTLRLSANEDNRVGMARFGIATDAALGVSMPNIRAVAAKIEADHALAEALWQTGLHEARILAALVDRPKWVTAEQMDRWTSQFNSWDVCDQVCGNLWDAAADREQKILIWAADDREFVRRAAFATIAWRAVHDKRADDADFLAYLPLIEQAASDDRNFVKKAVNWALRQIGKRSAYLNEQAISLSSRLANSSAPAARWIARDALRELQSEKVADRLRKRSGAT